MSWRPSAITHLLPAFTLLTLWTPRGTATDLKYSVTDLGALGPPGQTFAYAINNRGQVTGYSSLTNGVSHAFLWTDGVMQDLGALDWFGNPDPTENSWGRAVNDNGEVVGYSLRGSKAFLWRSGMITNLIPNFPTRSRSSDAYGINNSGHIVGEAEAPNTHAAFLWVDGNLTFLAPTGSLGGTALAINNKDQIVGFSSTSTGGYVPFLYTDGVLTDLLPGVSGKAYAINDRGQVVGYTGSNAFLWDQGTVIYLTNAAASWTRAYGINSRGHVVVNRGAGGGGALLYRDGTLFDLNKLIPSDSGWTLTDAFAINDNEQIVGIGHHSASGSVEYRGFILTPVPLLTIQADGASILLSWPKWAVGFNLYVTADFKGATTTWTPTGIPPTPSADDLRVTLTSAGPSRFYRLQKP